MKQRRADGYLGESQARSFLEAKGYRHVQSNYHCRWGEIDLIMQEQQTLIFVEVRTRRSQRYGDPLESVQVAKQKKLIKAAKDYLLKHPHEGPLRFDVVGITYHNALPDCAHVAHAFEVQNF